MARKPAWAPYVLVAVVITAIALAWPSFAMRGFAAGPDPVVVILFVFAALAWIVTLAVAATKPRDGAR